MPLRGLTIVVAENSSERFRSALNMTVAQAALGGRTRLFLDVMATALVREPIGGVQDDSYQRAGLPTLPQLYAEALNQGVRVILCQSGMAMSGAETRHHDPRVEYGGLVSLLADLGDDRLVLA